MPEEKKKRTIKEIVQEERSKHRLNVFIENFMKKVEKARMSEEEIRKIYEKIPEEKREEYKEILKRIDLSPSIEGIVTLDMLKKEREPRWIIDNILADRSGREITKDEALTILEGMSKKERRKYIELTEKIKDEIDYQEIFNRIRMENREDKQIVTALLWEEKRVLDEKKGARPQPIESINKTFLLLEIHLPNALKDIQDEKKKKVEKASSELKRILEELKEEITSLDDEIVSLKASWEKAQGKIRKELREKLTTKKMLRNQLKKFEEITSPDLYKLVYEGHLWMGTGSERASKILNALERARDELKSFRNKIDIFMKTYMDSDRIDAVLESWLEKNDKAKNYLTMNFEATPDIELKNLTKTIGLKLEENGTHPYYFTEINYSVAGMEFKEKFEPPIPVYLGKGSKPHATIAAGGVNYATQIMLQLREFGLPINSNVMKVLIKGTPNEARSLLEQLLSP